MTETAEHVIVRFRWDDDDGDDWIEGEGLLDPLLAALQRAGRRGLSGCSTWGGCSRSSWAASTGRRRGPGGSGRATGPGGAEGASSDSLASVAGFLKIDDDLIAVAAKASGPLVPVSDDGIADGLRRRPPVRRTSSSPWSQKARGRRWRRCCCGGSGLSSGQRAPRQRFSAERTAGELLAGAEARRAAREQAEARARGGKQRRDGRRSRPPPTSATWRTWQGARTRRGSRWRS